MKTKTTAKVLGAALLAMALAGTTTVYAEEEQYTIGIQQFAEHGSLDNCREGFLEGLKERGLRKIRTLL